MSEITAFLQRKYGSRGDQGRLVCDRLEQLWSDHRCLADRHFLREFCSSDDAKFIQRYWEMRLGELLRAAGWQLSSSEEGPDFKASKDDRVVWVEAVAPEAGTTEDRLPDDYMFPDLSDGGVAFCVPAEKIVLRVRTAIDSKHKALVGYSDRRGKYHPGYRDRGIVDAEDGYVIAVNTALLGTCGDEGSHLPSVVEAVFPTGPREIVVNRKTRQVIREGIGYRPVIRKQNDAPVFTSLFLDEAYRGISGIMGIHERPEGGGSRMPIMVHSPLAANGLPDGWCAAAYEFRVVDARDHWELKWRSTAKLTGGACGLSDPDNPPTDREFWREARTVYPDSPRWEVIRLHIDVDLLEWFKARRFRYQDEINQALRAYMEAHKDET